LKKKIEETIKRHGEFKYEIEKETTTEEWAFLGNRGKVN